MATNAFQYPFSRFYAEELKQSFGATSGNSFLLFFGRSVPWGSTFAGEPVTGSDISPPSNANSIAERYGAWRNAVAAKILEPDDLYHVFRRIDWESGTVYDKYDDSVDLFDGTKDFYVLTDEMNVYKCISNNNGTKSTFKPTSTSTSIFTTQDLYKWKFIFKVTEDSKRFLTQEYIPCQFVTTKEVDETLPQYNVQVAAVEGAIENLEITGDNSATYNSATESTDTSARVAGIYDEDIDLSWAAGYSGGTWSAELTLSDFNNAGSDWVKVAYPSGHEGSQSIWYDNTWTAGYSIYFHSGYGPEVGQLRNITDQITGFNGALLKLDSPLDVAVSGATGSLAQTKYVINPHAVISGDGQNATLRLVTGDDSKISAATVINRGTNYKNATVEIKTPQTTGSDDVPSVMPSISPQGGHGANPIIDFNASKIMVVIKIDGTEDNDLLIGDDFRQFGLIKNATISGGGKSGGGVYYNEIAGSEFSKTINFELTHPHGNTTGWVYAQGEDDVTFKEGDYIYGSESRATAQVKSWRRKVGGDESQEIGILEIDDMVGGFDIPTGKIDELRYIFENDPIGNEVNIQPTNIVTQSLDFSLGNSAEGTVISYDSDENELLVRLVSGSFGKTGEVWVNRTSAGASAGFTGGVNISLFENRGGELLKSFTVTNSAIDFRNYGNTQDIARARNQTEILSLYDRIPTYNLMYKFIITDSDSTMDNTTYNNTHNLKQVKSDNQTATSTVSKWKVVGDGSTGEMYVTNVFDTFESTNDGFTGEFEVVGAGADTTRTITSIQIPELNMGSGELLYIQNIRPISRTFDQQEEFKILLGF
ncbi:MAG: hypothetical protein H8D80_01010 [Proteobacteria bacterium]|nr:hypothetical protein [Pseudomonadota bacterium]